MTKKIITCIVLSMAMGAQAQPKQSPESICKEAFSITSGKLKISLMVATDNRLYMLGFGNVADSIKIPSKMPTREKEYLPPYGNGVLTEPAVMVAHADGNTSTELHYISRKSKEMPDGTTLTTISLKDPIYPFYVDACIRSFEGQNMVEMWNEIRHEESGRITLGRYASASPVINAKEYWVTQFSGNYKREATLSEERLSEGIKILDSKLGVRASQMRIPSFIISLNGAANENSGEVLFGSLKWSGSFQIAFDVDWNRQLRVLAGINPLGSEYKLEPKSKFITPTMLWSFSDKGKGEASRQFHRWALKHGVRDGDTERPVLLNNWEATYCNFDQNRLVTLFDGAKEVGAELFLLDDGWFGNGEFSRDDDKHGLGDWQVSTKKLPDGFSYLTKEATKRDIGFGVWIETEMVSPKSELYHKHPEWIITQHGREPILGRNQEVLDLTNPDVLAFEKSILKQTLQPNPDINYVKWDCNRYLTQPGSNYLSADMQSNLLIDYNNSLYALFNDFATKYPDVMGMLCAGGSGRADYGAMQYFHSFWPSDNTDPLARIKIQWGFGHFFPASTMSAHITRMGKRHLKLAVDVALSGALGIDLALDKATPQERDVIARAVELYKGSLRNLVAHGDLYRLVSPYDTSVASMSYVAADRSKAVLYIYQYATGNVPVIKPEGLDGSKRYKVCEVNIPKDSKSRFACHGKSFSGAELMSKGIKNPLSEQFDSAILEITQI